MMSLSRRCFSTTARNISRVSFQGNKNVLKFNLSTIVKKAQGEEAAYFRKEDEKIKAALRAKFESLLEKSDSDEDKKEVIELLGKL